MRRFFAFFLALSMAGCGSGGCGGKLPFSGPTAEEAAAQKQKAQDQLKEADQLVARYAEETEKNATSGGFKRSEGLRDPDPWGNQIKIDYHQEWFQEVATVRSAGPDGKFETSDDLTRVRQTSNPAGILKGISGFGWFCIVWVLCGLLAYSASVGVAHHRQAKGKSGKHRSPLLFTIILILLAPLALIVYGLQFLGGALGASGDFFDGFEFDFDLDLG
jgi:hypothetical protein